MSSSARLPRTPLEVRSAFWLLATGDLVLALSLPLWPLCVWARRLAFHDMLEGSQHQLLPQWWIMVPLVVLLVLLMVVWRQAPAWLHLPWLWWPALWEPHSVEPRGEGMGSWQHPGVPAALSWILGCWLGDLPGHRRMLGSWVSSGDVLLSESPG